ncbi:MAG: SUMF1/EgtB/PvdO family nonheme iron enzyme [Bacteroidota bacterium]
MKIKILFFLLIASGMFANNIEVSNISLTGQNTDDEFTLVQFDLSWENSWRISSGPSNYDGAWVFIKFKENSGNWEHATVNYVNGTAANDGHTEAAGSTITTSADGIGVFVYRNADGNGDVNFTGIQLRWNYGVDFVNDNSIVDVQVFAIEMVYIPQGSFELGSTTSGSESDYFYQDTGVFGFRDTYDIDSEASITISSAVGELYYQVASSENSGDQLGPIPAAFPKGYDAFWIMKYEVSEDQWLCFFNSLTNTQKGNHDLTDSDHKNSDAVVSRNTIAYTSGNATTDAPARACNFTSYEDMAAYLDWTGLRFITELEYEKAGKGPTHIINMTAAGTTTGFDQLYTIDNDGDENASISNPGESIGNFCYQPTDPGGPMRVGIFAASALNPTRVETGGSYYGVMELSGNLYERVIGVGSPINRAYTGNHGDGEILNSGFHNVANWPAVNSEGAICYRGGSWTNSLGRLGVADRESAALLSSITNGRIGLRGCRTSD